jgi:hypothetical protein
MLERRLGLVVFACAVIGLLPGCMHFTSSGRQQLAYAKYVRKQSHNQVKVATKFKKIRIPSANSSAEPKISGTSDGPQSVSSQTQPAQPAQSTQPAQTAATTPEPQSE